MKKDEQLDDTNSECNESPTSSRASSVEVTVKQEFLSFPLSPSSSGPSTPLTTWPYSALLTPQSLVTPSQLVLNIDQNNTATTAPSGVKRPPSPTPSTDGNPSSQSGAPTKRVKRKARTDEEKEQRAYERTMRNRRAAQESRDRKKRQFEALEEENRRLQSENAEMKRRIEQLEASQQQYSLIFDENPITTPPATESENKNDTDPVIKTEVFSPSETFDMTFHPAEMKFQDQQCLSFSPIASISLSLLQSWIQPQKTQQLFSTLFSIWTMMTLPWISLLIEEMLAYLLPATFNSLNTGSLFTGAENRLCGFSSRQGSKDVVFTSGKEIVDRLGKYSGLRVDILLLSEMYPIK